MNNLNPIQRIRNLCAERGWSCYQLSKASGIPYSTLNTMLNNQNMPSLSTLQKLCDGFGISITEFFDSEWNKRGLTEDQSACLTLFSSLSSQDKQIALAFLKGLAKKIDM